MSDHLHACHRCLTCPFGHKRPQGYLEVGGTGYTALACSVVACSFRDLLLSNREDRQAALEWLHSMDGYDLLTTLGLPLEKVLEQARAFFRCGEIRNGIYERGA